MRECRSKRSPSATATHVGLRMLFLDKHDRSAVAYIAIPTALAFSSRAWPTVVGEVGEA